MKVIYECQEKYVDDGTLIKEALKEQIKDNPEVIAAKYCNEVVSLNEPIVKDSEIELIKRTEKDGRYIYIRGLLYIMSKAFKEVYPDMLLTVNYQLSDAMFVSMDNGISDEEMAFNIKSKMNEIISRNIPIRKVIMNIEEAEEFYKREDSLKGRLQFESNKGYVSLYFCEEFYNYFYGVMPISTGFAKYFDFVKYNDGFLLKYPSKSNPYEVKPQIKTLKLESALNEYDEINKIMKINTVYRLNKKLDDGKLKELILFSESLHEKKIAEISSKIRDRKNVKLVLIAGPSSSGKTTFAGKLRMSLLVNGIKPITISVDNYFKERENTPRDENGKYDFECLEAIDTDLLNSHLRALLSGKEIDMPTFNFTTGHKEYNGNKMKLEEDEIIIMEGIHCLNEKLTPLISKDEKFKVYISDLTVLNIDYYNRISTTDTRLLRRIVRDYNFRGYSAEATLAAWDSVNRGEQKNIFPFQEDADCMFNSSIVYEISALKKYAEPLLKEIPNTSKQYSEAQRILSLLSYFKVVETDMIPNNSLLREFIGGSIY